MNHITIKRYNSRLWIGVFWLLTFGVFLAVSGASR
jgi:hypothetical protein